MGDTIPAFGRRCGVSPEAVRRWEAGRFDTTTLFDAFGRIGVDLTGLAEAVTRGYAEGIGSPWFEIEDIGKLGA